MHCELVIPGLFSAPAEARLPSLELLLARGRARSGEPRPLERWLAEAFGLEDEPLAAGALTALAGNRDPGEERWVRADPVHLRLMRDRLILVPAAAFGLSREEAEALCETLNEHFAGRLDILPVQPRRWSARLQMERAQKTFERQTTLNREGATPRLVYEKARQDYEASVQEFEIMEKAMRGSRENTQAANLKLAEAKRILAEKQLELQDAEGGHEAGEVRSPVDGTVVGRNGEPGKPAGEAGDQLFQIATDLYALEIPLEAKPELVKRLRRGQPATVMVLDLQGGGFPGNVKEVKENQVVVEFTSTLPAVRPGMRACCPRISARRAACPQRRPGRQRGRGCAAGRSSVAGC